MIKNDINLESQDSQQWTNIKQNAQKYLAKAKSQNSDVQACQEWPGA